MGVWAFGVSGFELWVWGFGVLDVGVWGFGLCFFVLG